MSATLATVPALTAAEALGPHLPIAVDLEASPIADGTVLSDHVDATGWSAFGQGSVVMLLAGPLMDALSGAPDEEDPDAAPVDRLAAALADACTALGVPTPLDPGVRPADGMLDGMVVGGDLSASLIASDDLALGLVLVTTPQTSAIPVQQAAAAPAAPAANPLATQLVEPVGGGRLDLLRNVEMSVTAELGRTQLTVRDLLGLRPGAVVELDKAAGSPVDLLVNGTLIARGEVVVVDEEYGVRITEIVGQDLGA